MMDNYIQVGVTAIRDPVTGEPQHSVPLYIRAEDALRASLASTEEEAAGNHAAALADLMKHYVNGCRAAGVPI